MLRANLRNRVKNPIEWLDVVVYLLIGTGLLLVLYPFFNTLVVSLVDATTYRRSPFLLVPPLDSITLENYGAVLQSQRILFGYRTTLILLVMGVPTNLLLSVGIGYVLARKRFPGQKILLYAVVFTMFFQGGLVPLYLVIRGLGLMNRYFSMIAPLAINTFYMLIIRNYFLSIPRSLAESAEIDGANDITILFRIILPTSKPVLATIGLFYAVDRWNEWFHGILFMRDIAKQPLQLALRQITAQVTNLNVADVAGTVFFENGVKTAAIFVVMTPIMLVYPFVQRYFMRGIMLGALKG